MPLLRLNKVSLAYGHRALLDEVELDVYRGERVCLVGRNGEGKSSLMRGKGSFTWKEARLHAESLGGQVIIDACA